MLIKQDGNLQTRHYTYVYMRCNHVHLQPCTYILDVNKRGVLGSADDDIAFFLHILSTLVVIYFLADHENVFLANTCIFYIFIIRYCICLHILTLFYCSWKDLFAIYMHILHICSTIYMEDTGRSKNASNILDF